MSNRYSRLFVEPYLTEYRFLRRRKVFDIVIQQILRQADLFGLGAAEGLSDKVELPMVGTLLAAVRAAQRMSLRELAAEARIDHKTISRIERGKANPTIGALQEIAKALGMQLHVSLADVGKEKQPVDPQQAKQRSKKGSAQETRSEEQRAADREWLRFFPELREFEELPPHPSFDELFGSNAAARGDGLG